MGRFALGVESIKISKEIFDTNGFEPYVKELIKEEKMSHKKYPYWAMPWYEEDVVHYSSRGRHPIIPPRYQSCELDGRKYKSFISRKNAEISLTTKYKENKGYSHFIKLSVDSTYFVVFQCKKCGLFHIMQKNNYKLMLQKETNGNKATQ